MSYPSYPISRPFPAKFAGTCAFSGLRVTPGEAMRTMVDGYDSSTNTYLNKRYVLNRFTSLMGEEGWVPTTSTLPSLSEGDRVTWFDKWANVRFAILKDGELREPNSYSPPKEIQKSLRKSIFHRVTRL